MPKLDIVEQWLKDNGYPLSEFSEATEYPFKSTPTENRANRKHKNESLDSDNFHVKQSEQQVSNMLDEFTDAEPALVFAEEINRTGLITGPVTKRKMISIDLRTAREVLETYYDIDTFCYQENCREHVKITLKIDTKLITLPEAKIIELANTEQVHVSSSESNNNKAYILDISTRRNK